MHAYHTFISRLIHEARYRNVLFVALLALIVMMPCVGHEFINWDDNRLVTANEAVQTWSGLFTIWTSLELPQLYPNYPLTMTMYWVEHQLWGLEPAGFHLVSVLLHAANAALVLVLLRRLGLSEAAAVLAAALFAAHPMQVESVAWVAERKNVLFTLFSLLTMLAYVKFINTPRRNTWAWAFTAFIAALLSKTAAVTVPCTLVATLWLKRERLAWRELWPIVPFFAAALVAGLVTAGVEAPPRDFLPTWHRPLLAVNAVAFYLARLVFPAAVLPVYPKWDFEPSGVFLIAPLALAIVTGLLFRYRKSLHGIVGWGGLHFILSLAPFLGLVGFGYHETSYVADRYVYFASIGLFAPLAVGVVHLVKRLQPKAALAACAGYVTILAVMTLMYVPVWRDSFTLWTYTIAHNPNCSRAHNNLAVLLEQNGDLDLAIAHYAYAMEMDPLLAAAPANYASLMARVGRLDDAESHFMRAAQIDRANPLVHYRLACVHVQQERFEDALVHLRIAERLNPGDPEVHCMAGLAHQRLGNFDKAVMLYRQTLEANSAHPLARERLAEVLKKQNEAVANAESEPAAGP